MGPRLLSPAPGWEASGAEFPLPVSNGDFEVQRVPRGPSFPPPPRAHDAPVTLPGGVSSHPRSASDPTTSHCPSSTVRTRSGGGKKPRCHLPSLLYSSFYPPLPLSLKRPSFFLCPPTHPSSRPRVQPVSVLCVPITHQVPPHVPGHTSEQKGQTSSHNTYLLAMRDFFFLKEINE